MIIRLLNKILGFINKIYNPKPKYSKKDLDKELRRFNELRHKKDSNLRETFKKDNDLTEEELQELERLFNEDGYLYDDDLK